MLDPNRPKVRWYAAHEKDRIGAMPKLVVDRLDHLVLVVSDVEATCAFYSRVLGMEVETFGRGRTALRFGRHKINLERAPGPLSDRPTPGARHLCFVTSTPLAEWLTHLTSCGVPLIEGPVKRSGAEGPIDSIYLSDPDDNSIEIATYVPARDESGPRP